VLEEAMQRKFDPRVFQLGYVALSTADIERASEHYLEAIGLTQTAKGDDGSVFLSVGYDHHNIVLTPASGKALLCIGFQLKPGIAIAEFAREARALGLAAAIKTDSQPGVPELVEVEGPGGNIFQFYGAMAAPAPGFKKTAVAPLRLGHVAVVSPDGEKLVKFYQEFLGFWYTDDIQGIATFLTCSRDHHVVNVVSAPESRLHHIAFELKDTSYHAVAADNLRAAGINQLWGPSRHTAGHNIAGYHHDPDRVLVELYTEMDQFVPELGFHEPRPWHEHLPMRAQDLEAHRVERVGRGIQLQSRDGMILTAVADIASRPFTPASPASTRQARRR
jgi:catechol 2,3-dioxygenase-like lactoylglutathione lyase family enzyme